MYNCVNQMYDMGIIPAYAGSTTFLALLVS